MGLDGVDHVVDTRRVGYVALYRDRLRTERVGVGSCLRGAFVPRIVVDGDVSAAVDEGEQNTPNRVPWRFQSPAQFGRRGRHPPYPPIDAIHQADFAETR